MGCPPSCPARHPTQGLSLLKWVSAVKASRGKHAALISSVQNASFTWRPCPEWRFNAGASRDCSSVWPVLSWIFDSCIPLVTAGEVERPMKSPLAVGGWTAVLPVPGLRTPQCWLASVPAQQCPTQATAATTAAHCEMWLQAVRVCWETVFCLTTFSSAFN